MTKPSNDIIPQQGLQGVMNVPKQRALELDITYECNMSCLQCNRGLGMFPSNEMMSIHQIEKILNESASMEQPFLNIRILGGEPTLHHYFMDILKILDRYNNQVNNCTITLWTSNGKNMQKIKKLPQWIKIHASLNKTKFGGENFDTFLAAPIDYIGLHDKNYLNGCGQIAPGKCGVGISPLGVYVCPVAASIDRILGLNIGLKKLKDISDESFRKQCNQLCRYCGHFLADRGINLPVETVSITWQKLKERIKRQN